MSSKKFYNVLVGCLILLIGIGVATAVYGNSSLQKSAETLNNLKVETNVIDEQQNSLAQAKRDIEKYADLEKIAKTIVPQEKDQARTVREIIKLANSAGVPIASVSFPNSDLGNEQTGPKKSPSSPVTQAVPVEGISGVYQLEVTIQNDADSLTSYPALINFLRKLEQNRRTSQVTNVNISPEPLDRSRLTYSMTINVYIKP